MNRDLEGFARDVLVRASTDGDPSLEEMLPRVYEEFRRLADILLRRERPDHTLRPTALANEAWLRLAREEGGLPRDPRHLLALAATQMRRALIDHARARGARKRGGGLRKVTLGESLAGSSAEFEAADLNRALERLGTEDPRKLQVVELLYFAGFTQEETSSILGVSSRTVVRDWRVARAWLWRELTAGPGDPPGRVQPGR